MSGVLLAFVVLVTVAAYALSLVAIGVYRLARS